MSASPRICIICKELRIIFGHEKCQRCYQREYRGISSRGKYADKMREYHERIYCKSPRKLLILETKNIPCKDCGIKYHPSVMDFDHVRGNKLFNIATGRTSKTIEELKIEISKCDIVCANCHRKRHIKEDKCSKV